MKEAKVAIKNEMTQTNEAINLVMNGAPTAKVAAVPVIPAVPVAAAPGKLAAKKMHPGEPIPLPGS